jgi:ankyrin repeat protein
MLNCRNKKDVVSMLAKGYDINEQDSFGNTLVHKTIVYGNTEFLKDLLELGANPRIKNYKGETPVFSIRKNKKEIEQILLDKVGTSIYTDFNNENKNYFSTFLK